MGNKYASIHIYGDNREEKIKLIIDSYQNKTDSLMRENLLNQLKRDDPKAYYRLINILNIDNNTLIIISCNCISIYDESNTFETIQNKAKELSRKIDSLITYTSNFDDDVFLFGAYDRGKLTASGKFGVGLPAYGMKRKNIIVDELCKVLDIDKSEQLCLINSLENINDIEDIIEKHL